jgi:hypothetical protein
MLVDVAQRVVVSNRIKDSNDADVEDLLVSITENQESWDIRWIASGDQGIDWIDDHSENPVIPAKGEGMRIKTWLEGQ